jgi:hypothetical protein
LKPYPSKAEAPSFVGWHTCSQLTFHFPPVNLLNPSHKYAGIRAMILRWHLLGGQ